MMARPGLEPGQQPARSIRTRPGRPVRPGVRNHRIDRSQRPVPKPVLHFRSPDHCYRSISVMCSLWDRPCRRCAIFRNQRTATSHLSGVVAQVVFDRRSQERLSRETSRLGRCAGPGACHGTLSVQRHMHGLAPAKVNRQGDIGLLRAPKPAAQRDLRLVVTGVSR